jgi:hypothetical protein
MPLTKKGKRIRRQMRSFYGKKRGDRVFYASERSGRITGVARGHAYGHAEGDRFVKGDLVTVYLRGADRSWRHVDGVVVRHKKDGIVTVAVDDSDGSIGFSGDSKYQVDARPQNVTRRGHSRRGHMRRRHVIGRSRRGEKVTSRYSIIVVRERSGEATAILLDSRNRSVNLIRGVAGKHSVADMQRLAKEHWPAARLRKTLPRGWGGEPLAHAHGPRRRRHTIRRGHSEIKRFKRVPKWAIGSEQYLGARVQLSPHLDRWMMGDKYGEVVSFGRHPRTARVKLDKSGKTLLFKLTDLEMV